MRDRTYCTLITIIAIFGAMNIPTTLVGLLSGQPKTILDYRYYLAPVSLALLLPATIGISRVQRWGFILLGMSFVMSLVSYPPLASLSGLMWFFIGLRYCLSRHEKPADGAPTGNHKSP